MDVEHAGDDVSITGKALILLLNLTIQESGYRYKPPPGGGGVSHCGQNGCNEYLTSSIQDEEK
jgi:hypothetical protein